MGIRGVGLKSSKYLNVFLYRENILTKPGSREQEAGIRGH